MSPNSSLVILCLSCFSLQINMGCGLTNRTIENDWNYWKKGSLNYHNMISTTHWIMLDAPIKTKDLTNELIVKTDMFWIVCQFLVFLPVPWDQDLSMNQVRNVRWLQKTTSRESFQSVPLFAGDVYFECLPPFIVLLCSNEIEYISLKYTWSTILYPN